MEVVNLNPFEEGELIDKRKDIAENCFLEIDLVVKSYNKEFGNDFVLSGISLLHSSISYLLLSHDNGHKLSNMDIEQFKIPGDVFKDENGTVVNDLSKVSDIEKLHYYTNLLLNSKEGLQELLNSNYFNSENYKQDNMFMSLDRLIGSIYMQYDTVLLLLNNKYNKLILNFI